MRHQVNGQTDLIRLAEAISDLARDDEFGRRTALSPALGADLVTAYLMSRGVPSDLARMVSLVYVTGQLRGLEHAERVVTRPRT